MPDQFPLPLSSYPPPSDGLLALLRSRIEAEPLNGIATAIFLLAVAHTFVAARFSAAAHGIQARRNAEALAAGRPPKPSVAAELLHFFGEVEVVFGLWVVPLLVAVVMMKGWTTAVHYLDETVNYTEPLFVVVIMALASSRPIIELAERAIGSIARRGGGTLAAWWASILILAPLLGSFITEPAAMTIAAVLLGRQFYARQPSHRLKYGTLGLLFVNVSIGGTLTHFAAPPVLMVARPWDWDTLYMVTHFGWRAALAIVISCAAYFALFRAELSAMSQRPPTVEASRMSPAALPFGSGPLPIPWWMTMVHVLFVAWTVLNAHHPALFLGGFLFFLGFDTATAAYGNTSSLKVPLLVGFFLAGLVIHGGLQAWWIGPVLRSLSEAPLFVGAAALTAFNDNALITYLATLVPDLSEPLKISVVQGAVVGGGLTVIANAPNPAGQALLGKYFGGSIKPLGLFLGAAVPTIIAALVFRVP
jgi:hypothetical protein